MSDSQFNASTPAPSPDLIQFVEQVREELGDSLISVVLYGPALTSSQLGLPTNLMVVLDSPTVARLHQIRPLAQAGKIRFGLALMLLGESEVQRATDVFPVKFLDMRQSHLVLHGKDVLADLVIRNEDLRLRCEQETRNNLLRLRSVLVFSDAASTAIRSALVQSFSSFLTTMQAFMFLTDGTVRDQEEQLIADVAALISLPQPVTKALVRARRGEDLSPQEQTTCLESLLDTLQRTAILIDRFETEG